MLPPLYNLPVGAPWPKALAKEFIPMFMLRLADKTQPKPNEVVNGRVFDDEGVPQRVEDEAERWRERQLEKMRLRRARGAYRSPTHRTTPLPPVPWTEGMEVLADGSLVNVLANTLNVPEAEVPLDVVHEAVREATGRSSTELARATIEISNTDDDETLDREGFRSRLRKIVPALATVGTAWLVQAFFNLYLLKEEAEDVGGNAEQWMGWSAVTGA